MGPARGGNFVQDGGGQVCESVCCFACDLDAFGIWVFFGPETRNFHPGGSGRGKEGGGLRVKDGSTGGPEGGREGCMWGGKNGLSLSLLLVSDSPPSLPHVFSCSSCRTPHSLSQGHAGGSLRDHCCRTGQLGRLQPARRHPRTETGDPAGAPPSPKPSVSFPTLAYCPRMNTCVSHSSV